MQNAKCKMQNAKPEIASGRFALCISLIRLLVVVGGERNDEDRAKSSAQRWPTSTGKVRSARGKSFARRRERAAFIPTADLRLPTSNFAKAPKLVGQSSGGALKVWPVRPN
jgi:hypothetical protein